MDFDDEEVLAYYITLMKRGLTDISRRTKVALFGICPTVFQGLWQCDLTMNPSSTCLGN